MRPVLVFDGDCAFCTTCVRFVERWLRTKAKIIAWQFADLDELGVTRARAEYELLWVDGRGGVFGGAQAVAKLLIDAGLPWSALGLLLRVPPVRWLAHGFYRAVANNRGRLPGGTPACALPADRRPLQR
ncbi:thiol-disulfide oxidoreductase DCC family protein [Nonomuraea sp. NPDC059194]|uniref:thiol-disulfide oxidoreductase DCC family protein n=1 Tax=Nonomuraea sp. NPDC059194 TaxID=3346764 RepID=UPI00369B9034